MDTRELAAGLREMAAEERATRAAIEAELRREHGGRLPEGWHERPEG